MSIAENYAWVREQVDAAARRSGRDPKDVLVVAVSKTVGLAEVSQALEAGVVDFGENRPDQLVTKQAAFPEANWHFIGNIQSRRIKDIVGRASLVHSLDHAELFDRFQRRCEEQDATVDALLEVNVSGEESKSGFAPDQVASALEQLETCDRIHVRGLMTMAPQGQPDAIRRTFSGLRELRDRLRPSFGGTIDLKELSMGMSEDFEVGVEEGATIVRVGRCIFDEDFLKTHEAC